MLQKAPTSPDIIIVPIEELYLASEAPKGADLQVRDSGRGSPLSDEELKASIYNRGIIQPLIWKELDDGKKYVVAGNRRLRFLREIFADALASPVKTHNVADFPGDWREIAIDTNLALPPHLVERYEIIVKLAKDLKLSEKETCARYGMSDSQYRRVMALGKMAPIVREAWKNGDIDAKTAQTFTLEPDPKEQEKIFTALSKGGHGVRDWDVQRRIVPQSQQEIGKLVRFVGLPAIKSAGLLKQEDLFATERSSNHIVSDIKALKKMVDDKLAGACQALVDAGWKWAMPEGKIEGQRYSYGDINPTNTRPTKEEKARLDEIAKLRSDDDIDSEVEGALMEEEEKIEQAIKTRGYSDEQRAKAGCFVSIQHDGSLSIDYGKVKPSERKSVQSTERSRSTAKAKPKKPGQVALTHALAERLSTSLQKGLAEAMVKSPHVAVSALIAGFASSGHVIDVDIRSREHKYVPAETNTKHFLQVFEGALEATPESRTMMLAKIAAEALSIVIRSGEAKPPLADHALLRLVEAMPAFNVSGAIKLNFNAKDYFDSIDLASIVAAVRCSMGDDHAGKVAKMKKADAAKFATEHLTTKGYLPPMLRTKHYVGPEEASLTTAAKKDKKPKPKKAPKKAPAKKKKR